MKRKVLALTTVLALMLALLAGCGGNTPSPAPAPPAGATAPSDTPPADTTPEPVTLRLLWHGGLNQTRVLREIVEAEFLAKYPHITLEYVEAPSTELPTMAMMEVTSGGGTYDLVMQSKYIPALASAGGLEPLDAYIQRDNFPIEKFINTGLQWKGQYYGLPLRADVRVLHYNQAYFEEVGLDPEKPPQTLEEIHEYARKFAGKSYFGINRQPNNPEAFIGLVYAYGGELLDANNEPVVNSEAGLKALNYILAEYRDGLVDPLSSSWQYSDEVASYLSGAAAIYNGWPARYIDAQMPEKSTIVGQSRVAPVPGERVYAEGWNLLMFSGSQNKEEAWEYMKFVSEADVQKRTILAGGDCNPTHLDVLNDPELQAQYEVLRAVSGSFDRIKPLPQTTQTASIVSLIMDSISKAVLDPSADPQAVLDELAASMRQVLVESGELSA